MQLVESLISWSCQKIRSSATMPDNCDLFLAQLFSELSPKRCSPSSAVHSLGYHWSVPNPIGGYGIFLHAAPVVAGTPPQQKVGSAGLVCGRPTAIHKEGGKRKGGIFTSPPGPPLPSATSLEGALLCRPTASPPSSPDPKLNTLWMGESRHWCLRLQPHCKAPPLPRQAAQETPSAFPIGPGNDLYFWG